MNILIAEGIHPTGEKILKESGFGIYYPNYLKTEAEIDAIILRSVFKIDKKLLQLYPRLKIIAKLGTGIDNIDIDACEERGIKVINTPGLNAISTAEFTVTQVMSLFKRISEITLAVNLKDYRRSLYFGSELSRKTVGVYGYGNVGKHMVKMLRNIFNQVYVYTLSNREEYADGNVLFLSSDTKLVENSDAIFIAVSLSGNKNMVNSDFLSRVKKNVIIANSARGALVDEKDLKNFLSNNKNAIYYCDVLENEPDYTLPPDIQDYSNPLLELGNVLFTPHLCGMTFECQEDMAVKVSEDILHFLSKNRSVI
jgi:D-3-phosphoglycerate dehydrogenase